MTPLAIFVIAVIVFCAAFVAWAACAQSSRVSWHQRQRVHRDGTRVEAD